MKPGRKYHEAVKEVLDGGKIILRRLQERLKEAKFNSRINENTIILRVN